MKADVTTLENKKAGTIDLDDAVFGLPIRADLLQRMVRWQLAKRRAGTHNTRLVGEISGSTAKPHRQKGSGHARAGSVRSALFRGGAVTHGPKPRDHSESLPKKVRKLALKTALSAKQADGKLTVLDGAALGEAKTAALSKLFSARGWQSVLVIDGPEVDANFARAAANLPQVDVLPQQGANVYDILRRDNLVLTKGAIEHLSARLK
jgi:large subunit ribosomal protein L4